MAVLGAGCLVALAALAAEGPKVLFDFAPPFDAAKVATSGVKVSAADHGLRLDAGHDTDWPGITLKPTDGKWDLSAYSQVRIEVKNVGTAKGSLCCRVDNPGADGVKNCNTGTLELDPGQSGTLTVTMKPRGKTVPGVKLFGMRGYPFDQDATGTIDTSGVTQLVVFTPKPATDTSWQLSNIRADGQAIPPALPPEGKAFLPFVDTFGQYIHKDWPGKIKDAADLRSRVATEAAELKAHPAPPGRDAWGGWADGPKLDGTGFFRVTQYEGKWWLVDPDGRLFWSHGCDCVGERHATPTEERDAWWQDFPGNDPALAEFKIGSAFALHGHYAGKNVKAYCFAYANLKRKYGDTWREAWFGLAHERLRSWGFNTIGNWSIGEITSLRRTAYTATVGFNSKMLEGSQGYWGKFRDVFDPSFAAGITQSMAGQRGKAAGDPWCLGFFVDNEIAWGDDTSLAIAALASPPEQRAKQVFVDDLKARYETIDKLNAAWGTHHADWAALLTSREAPDKATLKPDAKADLHAFYTKTAETYFKVIADAVHAAAPKQLYLGCRFAWVNDLAAQAAGKFCDVVSYNRYERSIANFKTNAGNVPLIIGEFHFGALDRGMFHTGLVPVATQEDRAKAYRSYVEGALKHPQWVGTHWFEYQDEPLTGRTYDEENYQIGFIDQQDNPYPETVAAARAVGAEMYQLRSGK